VNAVAILKYKKGFEIRFHKNLSGGQTQWCCSVKTYPAYMKKNSLGDITEEKLIHNHQRESEQKIERQNLRNAVKRKATDDIRDRPQKMILKGIEDIGAHIEVLDKTDENCVRKAIYAALRSVLPAQPKGNSKWTVRTQSGCNGRREFYDWDAIGLLLFFPRE